MPYAFFNELCPELAKKETRTLIVEKDSNLGLPPAEYALLEMFCNEKKCDCRRVFFYVVSSETNDVVAIIAYGWASKKYYSKWMRDDDPEVIKQLQGPILNPGSPQSNLAPRLLEIIENIILKDKEYIERIKTHYLIYRTKIERRSRSKRRRGKLKLRR